MTPRNGIGACVKTIVAEMHKHKKNTAFKKNSKVFHFSFFQMIIEVKNNKI